MIPVIVFTGGPCGGKSTILPIAKQWLEDHGYHVAVLAEAATEIIQAGFSPYGTLWPSNTEFQFQLLTYQLQREAQYLNMLQALKTEKKVLLCDRGGLDAMAYTGRELYLEVLREGRLSLTFLRDRYTAVVHLMSTARGAPEFYTLANNSARSETIEQAAAADERTQSAWLGHPHFCMIDNQTNFQNKVKRALAALARVLHLPAPLEIERKYVVLEGDIPTDAHVTVEIIQDYLYSAANEPERRVRKRVIDGAASYFYTSKTLTDNPGVRLEHERQIDLGEYEKLLRQKSIAYRTIRKRRVCFVFAGKHLELDCFEDILGPDGKQLRVLEVELTDINEPVELPPGWVVQDVTGKKEYSNATLAQG
jgi:CYTH domain-containing protein/predicted ATPase